MKKTKKLIALMLVVLMISSLVGCGSGKTSGKGGKGGNGGTEVELKYWNAGNGIEWVNALVDAFNESQSDWFVKVTSSTSEDGLLAAFGQADIDGTDVYMVPGAFDTQYMEPLNSLLEETAEGDKKPLKDKVDDFYLKMQTMEDGNIYTIGTQYGAPGIVYNKKLFEEARIDVTPRTTNELAIVCDKLVQKDIYAWTHFKGRGYYHYIRDIWQVQYDGEDYYFNNFLTLTDETGNSPSLDVLTKKDGRYEALKALEMVLTPENVYPGSNSFDHITAQTMFLNDRIGMMVNGNWLGREMASVGTVDGFEMMKTPVLSSLINKLDTIKNDQVLRQVVSAVDAVTDGTTKESDYKSGDGYLVDGTQISAADWTAVRKARNTVYHSALGNGTCIPNYSDEKEGAKEFLKFTMSDEGIKIISKYLHAATLFELSTGEELDTTDWNSFEASCASLTFSGEQFTSQSTIGRAHPIFALDMTDNLAHNYGYFHYFCAVNEVDRQSADEVWDDVVSKFKKDFDRWVEASK